jgi:hypothetical protein
LINYVNRLPVIPKAPPAPETTGASRPSAGRPIQAGPPRHPRRQHQPPRPWGVIKTVQDAEQGLANVLDQLAMAADFYLDQDLSAPLAFRLNRIIAG